MNNPTEMELSPEQRASLDLGHAVVKAVEAVQDVWFNGQLQGKLTCSLDEFLKRVC